MIRSIHESPATDNARRTAQPLPAHPGDHLHLLGLCVDKFQLHDQSHPSRMQTNPREVIGKEDDKEKEQRRSTIEV